MNFEQMKAKIAAGDGFIAALDQSGGSTPKALAGYGYPYVQFYQSLQSYYEYISLCHLNSVHSVE